MWRCRYRTSHANHGGSFTSTTKENKKRQGQDCQEWSRKDYRTITLNEENTSSNQHSADSILHCFTIYLQCTVHASRAGYCWVKCPIFTISYGAFKALRLRLSLAGGEASSSCRVLSPHDHTYSSLYTRVRCINYSHGLPWHQNAPKISKVKPQNDLHFISIL